MKIAGFLNMSMLYCVWTKSVNTLLLFLDFRNITDRSGDMNKIMDQLFQVAIYLRLSKDDGDFSSGMEGSKNWINFSDCTTI